MDFELINMNIQYRKIQSQEFTSLVKEFEELRNWKLSFNSDLFTLPG